MQYSGLEGKKKKIKGGREERQRREKKRKIDCGVFVFCFNLFLFLSLFVWLFVFIGCMLGEDHGLFWLLQLLQAPGSCSSVV